MAPAPAAHGPELAPGAIARYADTMTECARAAALELHEGQVVDVAREMTRITMRIVGKALFDVEVLDETDELGRALTCALRWVDDRMGFGFLGAPRSPRVGPGALALEPVPDGARPLARGDEPRD